MEQTTELNLKRNVVAGKEYTDGDLYIDNKWFAHVVEDKVRAKPGEWKSELKLYSKTAIPYGTYLVLVTWSNKFQRQLTGIFNVPDFEGIRIHNGMTERSSAGCLIISKKRLRPGVLQNDSTAMNELCKLVEERQKVGKVFIKIENAV